MIGRKPSSLDIALASARLPGFGHRDTPPAFERSRLDPLEPEMQFAFFYSLSVAWVLMYPLFAFPWLVVCASLQSTSFIDRVAVPVFVFGGVFCVVGVVDACWRLWLVWAARARYRQSNRTLDATATRLMRLAHFNDGTILLQLCIALIFAFHVWSMIA